MSEKRQDQQEGFLARWSRRKELSRKGEELPEPDTDTDHAQSAGIEATQEPSPVAGDASTEQPGDEAGALPTAELPPLESLGEDSDYSAFLGDGVPADLRQQALRKLFHSPKFNIRDGLDDYDWDFTNPEPLGDVVTAEMRYRVRKELERLAGLDEDEAPEEETTTVAAADADEYDQPDNGAEPEADDERTEPS